MPVEYHAVVPVQDPAMLADMRRRMRAYVRDDLEPHMLADVEVDELIRTRQGDVLFERPGTVILAAADACDVLAERFGPESPRGQWYRLRADELTRHAAKLKIIL